MNRKLFSKLMSKDLSKNKDFDAVLNSMPNVINHMINLRNYHTQKIDRGHMNLIVGMEELAELQQEISKALRGKLNRDGLIEEIVDVEHTLMVLKDVYSITDEDLNKARYIKTNRIQNRIKKVS